MFDWKLTNSLQQNSSTSQPVFYMKMYGQSQAFYRNAMYFITALNNNE